MTQALLTTCLGSLPLLARGKVRDIYGMGDELLFIATDRISAFDHVLGSGIPDKGKILTALSNFWFEFLSGTVENHLLATAAPEIAARLVSSSAKIFGEALSAERILTHPLFLEQIEGRSMVVRRAKMFPVECVVRGYISGSGWKDYRATGAICGIRLPAGLRDSDRLPEPIFTPAAKVNTGGHDENISFADAERAVGIETAKQLRGLSIDVYHRASEYAAEQELILADTKFEFGWIEGTGIVLADEVLTPDSSRYWPASEYAPGGPQPSFDKQYVRDYLESIRWNKQAPAPALPEEVVLRTRQKYLDALHILTKKQQFDGLAAASPHPVLTSART
ncbi:MAG TPA: phosphoribosylaminoimidazolesuccinocarboxamide synthase [Acidobacteriaceae bacterium]|jgi:phosphoribosylaminoimidazole-succinocarboxamide synthase|nr:phosphoribosylaminoimidazolesuccinocarboxamide synthase [Acidobacteriaceae bacterium]